MTAVGGEYDTPRGRILLVRHGQSTWNADGRWQGQADPPLSEDGIHQAMRAATAVESVDLVRSSDLARAHHTATILAARHGLPVVSDVRLRERAAGPWTGLTRDEIERQFPGFLADGRRPAGYETDDDLAVRALAALREIADDVGTGTAVVVSHGGVILTVERWHGITRSPIHNLEGRWLVADPASATGFTVGERVTLL
jgi:probable phosphoglycerate mutase